MLLTSAMPSGAARLAGTNRFPKSVRSRLESVKNPQHGGASSVSGISSSLEPCDAEQMKTSVRFQAVGLTMVLSNVLDHSEEDFVPCLLKRKHLESQIVTNAVG